MLVVGHVLADSRALYSEAASHNNHHGQTLLAVVVAIVCGVTSDVSGGLEVGYQRVLLGQSLCVETLILLPSLQC